MKKYLVILILFCSALIIILSQKGNPILRKDPDAFADQVNAFEARDMGNKFINTCANFYAYPEKIQKSVFDSQNFEDELKQSCGKDMQHLATYLNRSPDFQHVTAIDLQQQTTWLHYFKSKKAHSG